MLHGILSLTWHSVHFDCILPTYVASGAAVIIRAVAEETVHIIFTLSIIHARITGALVNVCVKKQRRLHDHVQYTT